MLTSLLERNELAYFMSNLYLKHLILMFGAPFCPLSELSSALSGTPLKVKLLALLTNKRLGLKGIPGTNTLAYFEYLPIAGVTSFITLASDLKLYIFLSFYVYIIIKGLCSLLMGRSG